jgi:hypothetical protein
VARAFSHVSVASTVILGCIAGLSASWLSLDISTMLFCSIAGVLCAGAAVRIAQAGFDPFDPFFIFCAAWTVIFIVHPAFLLASGQAAITGWGRVVDVRATIDDALVLGLLGATGFTVGYLTPTGKRPSVDRLILRPEMQARAIWTAVAMGGFGVLLFAIYLQRSNITIHQLLGGRSTELIQANYDPSQVAYFTYGPFLAVPAALILVAVGLASRSWPTVAAGCLFAAFVIGRGFAQGDRLLLLPLLGSLLVFLYLRRGRRPHVIGILAICLVFFVAVAVIRESRDSGQRVGAGSVQRALIDAVTNTVTSSADSAEGVDLAAALTVVPDPVGHTWGMSSLGDLVTRPIPRALWQGKPLVPKFQIVRALWPEGFANHSANPEFTPLLVFFMDFSYPGALLGMFLYGVVARAVYESYRRRPDSIRSQLIFAMFVPFVIMAVRDGPVDTFVRGVFLFLPILVAFSPGSVGGRTTSVRRTLPLPSESRETMALNT